ncbi:hypothetical protein WICANDRAFT_64070 [Wickerhamomyces anomalus NRRL Y-366-8]|uniref:Uncharacterized protein n=1 Tax=Wickerhamomyces anomalus (strain ATCC 58044 / CBS 1984 / NCYC 433 / NRRL Y-366-8) TaxID=683960 RepID=A0A1E3NXN0_WICAA|nr:uncharacterized protein WICANDRAFT_64070 [Wickerhamomyces anomalus NRRL Y-366-8]ODQ57918.1 hypothetical protein WICANDRAFT_64070 [Wickerhamomyces anomalus NRRL Y-366-8]
MDLEPIQETNVAVEVNGLNHNGDNALNGDKVVDNCPEELASFIEPSSLDIEELRLNELSNSSAYMEAKLKIPELIKSIEDHKLELSTIENEPNLTRDIELFFDYVLKNVSSGEHDRNTLIERNKLILESKILTLPLRICAFNYASDYDHGANQLFIKLKNDTISMKTKRIQDKITDLTSDIMIKENELKNYQLVEIEELNKIEELIKQKKIDDNVQRIEMAKQKKQDQEIAKQQEIERLEREKLEEIEKIRKAKEDELQKIEQEKLAKLQKQQDDYLQKLKDTGYSKSTAFIIDEKIELSNGAGGDKNNGPIKVKQEGFTTDKAEELLNKFKQSNREGRRRLRTERAAKRERHKLQRSRGEQDISDDDLWLPELDGIFSDDDLQNPMELDDEDENSRNNSTTPSDQERPSPSYVDPNVTEKPSPQPLIQPQTTKTTTQQQQQPPITKKNSQDLSTYLQRVKSNELPSSSNSSTASTASTTKRPSSNVFIQTSDPRKRKKLLQQQTLRK